MLNIAHKKTYKMKKSHITDIIQADIENIPLRDEACTTLVSFTVVTLTDHPQMALKEFKRVSSRYIVSILKKSTKTYDKILRPGVKIAETEKDIIFYH